jgi:hypothetical protein
MNKILREEIVKHVFSNFAILPSRFVNLDKSKSLASKEFLLHDKIPFTEEDGTITKNRVWGCQISAELQEIKILLGECTQDKDYPEYALLLSMKNSPSYGVYIVTGNEIDSEALIAVSMNGKDWLECRTYLQATFLAGMEQIRDVGLSWDKCSNYKDQLETLLSFIKFHTTVYEDKYEGQEG